MDAIFRQVLQVPLPPEGQPQAGAQVPEEAPLEPIAKPETVPTNPSQE